MYTTVFSITIVVKRRKNVIRALYIRTKHRFGQILLSRNLRRLAITVSHLFVRVRKLNKYVFFFLFNFFFLIFLLRSRADTRNICLRRISRRCVYFRRRLPTRPTCVSPHVTRRIIVVIHHRRVLFYDGNVCRHVRRTDGPDVLGRARARRGPSRSLANANHVRARTARPVCGWRANTAVLHVGFRAGRLTVLVMIL